MTAELLAEAGDVARTLEPTAVAVFLGAGAVIAVAEYIGIAHKRDHGDTISDMVWWLRDKLPRPARYGLLAAWLVFIGWLTGHFAWGGS